MEGTAPPRARARASGLEPAPGLADAGLVEVGARRTRSRRSSGRASRSVGPRDRERPEVRERERGLDLLRRSVARLCDARRDAANRRSARGAARRMSRADRERAAEREQAVTESGTWMGSVSRLHEISAERRVRTDRGPGRTCAESQIRSGSERGASGGAWPSSGGSKLDACRRRREIDRGDVRAAAPRGRARVARLGLRPRSRSACRGVSTTHPSHAFLAHDRARRLRAAGSPVRAGAARVPRPARAPQHGRRTARTSTCSQRQIAMSPGEQDSGEDRADHEKVQAASHPLASLKSLLHSTATPPRRYDSADA